MTMQGDISADDRRRHIPPPQTAAAPPRPAAASGSVDDFAHELDVAKRRLTDFEAKENRKSQSELQDDYARFEARSKTFALVRDPSLSTERNELLRSLTKHDHHNATGNKGVASRRIITNAADTMIGADTNDPDPFARIARPSTADMLKHSEQLNAAVANLQIDDCGAAPLWQKRPSTVPNNNTRPDLKGNARGVQYQVKGDVPLQYQSWWECMGDVSKSTTSPPAPNDSYQTATPNNSWTPWYDKKPHSNDQIIPPRASTATPSSGTRPRRKKHHNNHPQTQTQSNMSMSLTPTLTTTETNPNLQDAYTPAGSMKGNTQLHHSQNLAGTGSVFEKNTGPSYSQSQSERLGLDETPPPPYGYNFYRPNSSALRNRPTSAQVNEQTGAAPLWSKNTNVSFSTALQRPPSALPAPFNNPSLYTRPPSSGAFRSSSRPGSAAHGQLPPPSLHPLNAAPHPASATIQRHSTIPLVGGPRPMRSVNLANNDPATAGDPLTLLKSQLMQSAQSGSFADANGSWSASGSDLPRLKCPECSHTFFPGFSVCPRCLTPTTKATTTNENAKSNKTIICSPKKDKNQNNKASNVNSFDSSDPNAISLESATTGTPTPSHPTTKEQRNTGKTRRSSKDKQHLHALPPRTSTPLSSTSGLSATTADPFPMQHSQPQSRASTPYGGGGIPAPTNQPQKHTQPQQTPESIIYSGLGTFWPSMNDNSGMDGRPATAPDQPSVIFPDPDPDTQFSHLRPLTAGDVAAGKKGPPLGLLLPSMGQIPLKKM